MRRRILITGGAGFIGSHLADELLAAGHHVRALDALVPQVHQERRRPDYLDPDVELITGDVRDRAVVDRALHGVDLVFHLAAQVGVGQSMYQLCDYTSTNIGGTATLLEALIARPVERIIVASSMSIYGEGLYRDSHGSLVHASERSSEQLAAGHWNPIDTDGTPLEPLPTPETKTPSQKSVYALSKFDQERLCLMVGESYRIPAVAMRFFNVYGPRQALSNPYTGVLAIFGSRLLNRRAPVIYEDGRQRRDFVSVYDVSRALRLSIDAPGIDGHAFNIGSGTSSTVRDIATQMAGALGVDGIEADITGQYRVGDIRHCFADITKARMLLGYQPQMALEEGLLELAGWLGGQEAYDRVAEANAELARRGLTL
ncbi:MAG: NAD-dependent epimerase/dehydratase family protein [Vicinamibacterales bacterium]